MTVGHAADVWEWRTGSGASARSSGDGDVLLSLILEREPDGEPGQVWAYNQVGTYLVAQAIAAATGQSPIESNPVSGPSAWNMRVLVLRIAP